MLATIKPKRTTLALALITLGLGSHQAPAVAQAARPTQSDTSLSTVTVIGDADQRDAYRATSTKVGKVLQDPHDVAQAVTTVTRSLMDDQAVGSLKEALKNVSGLTFNAAEGGRAGDNMMLRGFYTFGDMYLDGIRDTAQYNRETYNLEQVDVLRGAAAMLFGRGQAGGVINQVTKTAFMDNKSSITTALGTNDHLEFKGDFNRTLGKSSAIRVNVMNRDEGSWRSNPSDGAEPEVHRTGLAASLAWGIYTDHQFTLNTSRLETRDNPDYGISFDSSTKRPTKNFPVDYFWGTQGSFDDSATQITTLAHQFKISDVTRLNTQIRTADYDRAYWAQAPNREDQPTSNGSTGSAKTRKASTTNHTLQSDLSTRFYTGRVGHELLAGVEYLYENSKRWSLSDMDSSSGRSYSPDVTTTTAPSNTYQGDSYAVYAQDTISLSKSWSLTGGLRRDEMKTKNASSSSSTRLSFGEWSSRASASYKPTAQEHYYLSWSDSFSPTADLYQLDTGSGYPAERSQAIELGGKWFLRGGDLALRAAIYRAEKEWERNTDLESSASILTKKRRTDGIDLEASGEVAPSWELFSGLSLMNAKILEAAPGNTSNGTVGKRPRNTPPFTLNVWLTHALNSKLKVGGGLEVKAERYGYSPSSASAGMTPFNMAPAYARLDMMVRYEDRGWSYRLNIQNLLDQVYYDAIYDNGGFTVPGQRRKIIVTGEYKF
jgi:catecholate siderophore receptor